MSYTESTPIALDLLGYKGTDWKDGPQTYYMPVFKDGEWKFELRYVKILKTPIENNEQSRP